MIHKWDLPMSAILSAVMTEQMLRNQTRSFDCSHSRIFELVELISLCEVSQAIRLPGERCAKIARHAPPHRHIARIIDLRFFFFLVKSPVFSVGEEIGFSVVTEKEREKDSCQMITIPMTSVQISLLLDSNC